MDGRRKIEETLMAQMPGGIAIYRLKKNGKVTTDYVSESLAKMCGYGAKEFLAYLKEDALVNLVQEDVPGVMKVVTESLEKDEPIHVRYHIYTKEKEPMFIRLDANAIPEKELGEDKLEEDDAAVVYAVHTIISDEAEKLIESQKQLSELVDKVPGGLGIYDIVDGKPNLTYLNDAYYEMLGDTREHRLQYYGENVMQAIKEEDKGAMISLIQRLIAGEDKGEALHRIQNKEGKWIWLNLRASVVEREGNRIRVYATFADYTSIQQAKQEQEATRVTLETAMQAAKVLTWKYDYRKNCIIDTLTLGESYHLGKQVDNMPEAMINLGYIDQGSLAEFRRLFTQLSSHHVSTVDVKVHPDRNQKEEGKKKKEGKQKKDGNIVWYRIIDTPVFDDEGNFTESVGIAIDITEQKEREQQYEEQIRLNRIAMKDAVSNVSLNLTKNQITSFETVYPEYALGRDYATADDLLGSVKTIAMSEEELEKFNIVADTKTMIGEFRNGNYHMEISCHIMERSKWYRVTYDMIENPYTMDIEAVSAIYDETKIVQSEKVINQLLAVDYQSIVLIDTKTGETTSYQNRKGENQLNLIDEFQKKAKDKTAGLEAFFRMFCVPGTADEVIEQNSMPCIIRHLEKESYYENMYSVVVNGKTEHFRILYCYLDGDQSMILSAAQNVTDIYDRELQQKAEIKKALDTAKQANYAKTDFMSRMSHDMRTPMNAIIGLTALTIDDAEHPDVVLENMGKMRQASDFLLGLLNDILDMAKIEDGSVTLNMEPYAYSEFLLNMKTMFIPQCEAKGIDITFVEPEHMDPVGLTDKIRINQIFFNIFSNAVKYTATGGSIHSSVRNIKIENSQVSGEYVIVDTGIGMSEKFQEHLFEPFAQEDGSVTPELQGSGLGLSITKQLVELMGGHIQVESEAGKGTTVIVQMAFQLVEKKEVGGQQALGEEKGEQVLIGKNVLLCEDHPLNAQIARKLLEKKQMIVTHAQNGRVAVEKFEASKPDTFDAILMDIRMPELSGLKATKEIRRLGREDAKTVPIIAMSANAYPEDIQKSKEAGMNAHLAKPVDPQKLYETLEEWV